MFGADFMEKTTKNLKRINMIGSDNRFKQNQFKTTQNLINYAPHNFL